MPTELRFYADPDAKKAYARERSAMQHIISLARKYGLRREEAQRFIERQRRSLARQKAQSLLTKILHGQAILVCLCGLECQIRQTPLTCPQCKRRWLEQKGA